MNGWSLWYMYIYMYIYIYQSHGSYGTCWGVSSSIYFHDDVFLVYGLNSLVLPWGEYARIAGVKHMTVARFILKPPPFCLSKTSSVGSATIRKPLAFLPNQNRQQEQPDGVLLYSQYLTVMIKVDSICGLSRIRCQNWFVHRNMIHFNNSQRT